MKDAIIKGGREVQDPRTLLEAAKQVPTPKVYRALYEYGDTIHLLLTEKRMTYREIAEWFNQQGFHFSQAHFSNAYSKWKALNGIIS